MEYAHQHMWLHVLMYAFGCQKRRLSVTLHLIHLRQDLSLNMEISSRNSLVYPSHIWSWGYRCMVLHTVFVPWVWQLGPKSSCLAASTFAHRGIFPFLGKDFLKEPQIIQSIEEYPLPVGFCSVYFNSWGLLAIPKQDPNFSIQFIKSKNMLETTQL